MPLPGSQHLIAALAVATICLSGCSPGTPSLPAAGPAARPAGHGLVWRVTGGKSAFFLAGSFHLLQASDYPLPEPYEIAWCESSHLVMEIPPGDAQQPATIAGIEGLIHLQSGTLAELISPTTWQDLTQWADRTSYPVKALETLTPWMAGLTVAVTTSNQLGYKSGHGLERHFTARLAGSGKTAEGLETTLGQLSLFQQVAPEQQESMLRQALAESHHLADKAVTLIEAWRSGNAEALHSSLNESFRSFPELKKLLLDDRNAAWLPRLESLLQGNRPVMVLVGAGHLCGPGSVIGLLEAKGYRCTQIITEIPSRIKKAA